MVVRSAVLALEVQPTFVLLQIRLAKARLAMEPFAIWVARFAGTERWHLGTQTAVVNAVAACGQPVEDLERAEATWVASPDPVLRWLALRVLVQVAGTQGWIVSRRARLDRFRLDPSPAVADEAAFTFPPDEDAGRG